MATEVLYHGRKPTEWRYYHCISCGTVWRDDCDSGALHVIMQCPVCKISCSDIVRDEAVAILKQRAAIESLELWNTEGGKNNENY